jgi:hypothetical protein
MLKLLASAVSAMGLFSIGPASPPRQIANPEGFRSWTHVKTAINDPQHAQYGRYRGIYHIYANPLAMQGYRTGKFPDGAVIVFDLRDVVTTGYHSVTGERRFIDVMEKDAGAFPTTGGWGYEEFAAGTGKKLSESDPGMAARCHGCHVTQAARDFVYSGFSE